MIKVVMGLGRVLEVLYCNVGILLSLVRSRGPFEVYGIGSVYGALRPLFLAILFTGRRSFHYSVGCRSRDTPWWRDGNHGEMTAVMSDKNRNMDIC
jgi:hypothetical protein